MSKPTAIGLFSGAGGLEIGLENAGFKFHASVELDPVRCKTLGLNRKGCPVLCEDVRAISGEDIKSASFIDEIDLVAAGPPCQPFSKLAYWVTEGKVKDVNKANLIFEPVRLAMELNARAVLIENVPGLCYKHARPLFDILLERLESAGYFTTWAVVNAADYGVPQLRKRLIIIGMRDIIPQIPEPTIKDGRFITAGDAIGDLDNGHADDFELVGGKHGKLLQLIPPGKNYIHLTDRGGGVPHFRYRSRYWSFLLKLSPDLPSWTIPAQAGSYTGPFHWRNRRLRISELKRLQTFPDDWIFYGSDTMIRRQIGDAVPPLLAQRLGDEVIKRLND